MVMDTGLFDVLRNFKLSSASLRADNDFVDRLNHYYTGMIIILFTIIVSAKQYVGQPLQCWVPAEYTDAMEQYAENYCWVENTYWLPFGRYIPKKYRTRESLRIGYYQWVPFFLTFQGLMFYLPNVVWKLLNWQSGLNIRTYTQFAIEAQQVSCDNRAKTIISLARHIEQSLEGQREYRVGARVKLKRIINYGGVFCFGRKFGNFLSPLYIWIKLLYLLNILGQFVILNRFLGTPYRWYGIEVLMELARGNDWIESGQFPRVTMCDFDIRVIGNLHRHTIQCVLMINLFNEKIFIFLWFWFMSVAILTALSLLYWLPRLFLSRHRVNFVFRYLRMYGGHSEENRRSATRFVENYLRNDGIFVLYMIRMNSGDSVAGDVINQLWLNYQSHKRLSFPEKMGANNVITDSAAGSDDSDSCV